MALQTLFGSITKVAGVDPTFTVQKTLLNGGGGVLNDFIFDNVTQIIPARFRCLDYSGWNNTGGAQGGAATTTLTSNLAGIGGVAVSDALNINGDDARTRCATLDPAQATVTTGDTLYSVKDVNTTLGIVWVIAQLL